MTKRNQEIIAHNALAKSANNATGGIKLEKVAGEDRAFDFG